MCGINLILNTALSKDVDTALAKMQEASAFRGPDASNTKVVEEESWQLGVGVNRLMVVDDDQSSNQPMISDCGNYILAFNGEVYNFQDLKNKLIVQGQQFSTHSDTEVVLYWLKKHGSVGLADFKGMFALAFINLKEKTLFISRDRHGIKPLFYYSSPGLLIVSSTIKSIKASTLAQLNLNENAIAEYLAFRHVMGQSTFYEEVVSVKPGEVLKIDQVAEVVKDSIVISTPSSSNSLKEALIESVSLLHQARMTPGLMLSGGIDSTLLLAIYRNELNEVGLPTYTLNTGTDAQWARVAAQQYGANHQEMEVSAKDLIDNIEPFLEQCDQPIADHGALAIWLVAKKAKQHSNVLLSGAGADELFGGYRRHRIFAYYLKQKKTLLWMQRLVKRLGADKALPKRLKILNNSIDNNPNATFKNFLQNYGVKKYDNLGIGINDTDIPDMQLLKSLSFDKDNYLVNDVLSITDNAAMQQGIEVRVPYLFDDVLACSELQSKSPFDYLGKKPLKELLLSYGGKKYVKRPKQGFGLPMEQWLRDKQTFGLWDFMNSDSPIFSQVSKSKIEFMIQAHQKGKADYNMQLWSILVLENWLRRT